MSLHTNLHAPRTAPSGRIKNGNKCGYLLFIIYIFRVNIMPPRHSFGKLVTSSIADNRCVQGDQESVSDSMWSGTEILTDFKMKTGIRQMGLGL